MVQLQKDNVVQTIPLTDVIEFSIQQKALTDEVLKVIRSYDFVLREYFNYDKHMYCTFKREM